MWIRLVFDQKFRYSSTAPHLATATSRQFKFRLVSLYEYIHQRSNCDRGLNGTTSAVHADNSGVYIPRWPAFIDRAALIQTWRIWARAADFEPFFVDADVDTDVRILLEPYRRPPI